MITEQEKRSVVPFSITVDATTRCNFACSYCYCGPEHLDQVLDVSKGLESLERVWPKVRETGGFSLGFMGGEPLCAFDVIQRLVTQTMERCVREGLRFQWGMTSNMSLFTDDHAEFSKMTNGGVHPSLDGNVLSHNLNRPFANGQPSFEAVMNGVGVLRRHDMLAGVRMTITPVTLEYLADNLLFLVGEGFKAIAAFPAFSLSLPWNAGHFRLVKEQARQIAMLRRSLLRAVESIHPFDAYAYAINHGASRSKLPHHCGACRSSLAMDVDGHLYPCHRFTSGSEFEIHNLKTSWTGVKDQFEAALSPGCATCKAFGACRGGCWAENKASTGSLASPSVDHCRYNIAFYDGIVDAGYICPGSNPPHILIAGEGSCVFTDVCVACNCSGRPGCGHCDERDRCNRCDYCDDCHRCDKCEARNY